MRLKIAIVLLLITSVTPAVLAWSEEPHEQATGSLERGCIELYELHLHLHELSKRRANYDETKKQIEARLQGLLESEPDHPAALPYRFNLLLSRLNDIPPEQLRPQLVALEQESLAAVEASKAIEASQPIDRFNRTNAGRIAQDTKMLLYFLDIREGIPPEQSVYKPSRRESLTGVMIVSRRPKPTGSGASLTSVAAVLMRKPRTPKEAAGIFQLIPLSIYWSRGPRNQEVLRLIEENPDSPGLRRYLIFSFPPQRVIHRLSDKEVQSRSKMLVLLMREIELALQEENQGRGLSIEFFNDGIYKCVPRSMTETRRFGEAFRLGYRDYQRAMIDAALSGRFGRLSDEEFKDMIGAIGWWPDERVQPQMRAAARIICNARRNPFNAPIWPGWHNDGGFEPSELAKDWVLPYLNKLEKSYGHTPEDLRELRLHLDTHLCAGRWLLRGGYFREAEQVLQKVAAWQHFPHPDAPARGGEYQTRLNGMYLYALCRQQAGHSDDAIRIAQEALAKIEDDRHPKLIWTDIDGVIPADAGEPIDLKSNLESLVRELTTNPQAPYRDPFEARAAKN